MKSLLFASVKCPHCNEFILDRIEFAWGAAGQTYDLTNKIKWFAEENGEPVPSCYLYPDKVLNFGSPKINKVISFDELDFAPGNETPCPYCFEVIGGIGIEISQNKLNKILCFNHDFIDKTFIEIFQESTTLIEKNNQLVPYNMPDEFSHNELKKNKVFFLKDNFN